MKKIKKKISILIPVYNEQSSLPLLYAQLDQVISSLHEYEWELLFVNDGSKDNTHSILCGLRDQDKRVHFLELVRNYGKETAMLAGLDHVSGDCVIIMDADLQHPPTVIPLFLEKWQEGYEDVYGKRITRGRESYLRKVLSLSFYKILKKTTKIDILENVCDFRLLDRKCIEMLKQMREHERYTKGLYCLIGGKKVGVLFEQKDRVAGQTSYSYLNLLNFAIEGITSFTVFPLQIASIAGVFVSLFAFIYMIYIIMKAVLYGDSVSGYPSLMAIILFLGGIQLLFLGFIGEYLGRIFNETKNRPNYFIASINGMSMRGQETSRNKCAELKSEFKNKLNLVYSDIE